jgi:hypothetical protein
VLLVLLAGGCAGGHPGGPPPADTREIAALAREIGGLGPGVDPGEARRAAQVAFEHTRRLALEYEITDPPLVHNAKVNMGLKPRGLCWHWADDLEARLAEENFRTLSLHRAIANADEPFRIDHSTVIVSRRGDTMFEGVVLDPWRNGGVLHWTRTRADADYDWRPRAEVHEMKLREAAREGTPLGSESLGQLAALPG